MSPLVKTAEVMSIDRFLDWEPESGQHYELVDGQPRAMAPANTRHAYLRNELGSLIRNHLRAFRPECDAFANPGVVPGILSAHNVRIPDLGVTCSSLVQDKAILTDPVLLVEILSPSNAAKTWSNVWTYTSMLSVQEVLVLHTTHIHVELLRRQPDRLWPREPEYIHAGDLTLTSIGFRVAMAELYARTDLTG